MRSQDKLIYSILLFSHYKSQDIIINTCFKHSREREREGDGFHAAKEDSYAQKDSYPASPYHQLQICNIRDYVLSFSVFSSKIDYAHLLKMFISFTNF
jgi:hypothetical protein